MGTKITGNARVSLFGLVAGLTLSFGCSKIEDTGDNDNTGGGTGNSDGTGGSGQGNGNIKVPIGENTGGGTGNGDGDGDSPICETSSEEAELAPVFLAFAFDVSGSMGQYDQPHWWHDMTAKWTPVRQATQAFVEDTSSAGISASLTFFPASSNKCVAATYQTPQVAMTELPTNLFATSFDSFEASGNWGSGTPTLAAAQGVSTYLQSFQGANPNAKFALVLVTDGLPQGCDGANDIGLVATTAANVYSGGTGIPTYVIGVNNPTVPPTTLPSGWDRWLDDDGDDCGNGSETGNSGSETCAPPNGLAGLHSVAAAGGTTEAFLIDTGDPDATRAAFLAAIDAIRTDAISCEIGIPAHPSGGSFDPDRIDVSYTPRDGDTARFDYDAECLAEGAWHYDDESNPTLIQLCDSTCDFVQSQPGIQLNVDFLCIDRPPLVR